jgi:sensor histidine kinase YesM
MDNIFHCQKDTEKGIEPVKFSMALFKKSYDKWKEVLILAVSVLLLRVFYVELFNYLKADYQYDFLELLNNVFREYPITFFMVISGFFSIRYINKLYNWGENPIRRILLFALTFIAISLLSTLLLCLPKLNEYSWSELFASRQVEVFFVISAMMNIVIMGISDIILYYIKSHKKALDAEISERNKARFKYEQLKRQLNPHFLFNSLNVLDYLVQTDSQRASDFIKKLAGVYRYLLSKENDPVVFLEEELEFAKMYADLLKERFTDGLEITVDIEGNYYKTLIVPCSIQLLIENATKHNIINSQNPLYIKIYIVESWIYVENNYQPRLSVEASNKLGLKNIDGQYKALFKKSISISRSDERFIVKLPLIDNKK